MRTSLRPKAVLIGALVLAVFLAAQATGNPNSAATKRVSVRDDIFSPRSARVARNDKVVWRWRGSNPHNVRFRTVPRGASKRGSNLQTSGRFARTFDRRGTYRYVCTVHQATGMKGSVKVE